MIETLTPYPSYKATSEPWLGSVPAHWGVFPNRATFVEMNSRGHEQEELLSVTIAKGVIRQADLIASSAKKDSSNENKANYKLVCPGDFAYNKMRAWQGAAGVSAYRGIVSPAYVVVRPRQPQEMRYFHYLFRTPAFGKEAERWSYGISSDQWSLRIDEFKRIYACVPPLDEQKSIVRFLDHVDRRIRRYIRAKRQLIALLNEQKQAIIHGAVTRGLNPNVRLKTSGVEWLGEIPEHWDALPIGAVCRYISYGFTNPMPTADTGPYMLTANDIGDGRIRFESARRTTQSAFDDLLTQKSRPQAHDVLVTKDGTLGRIAISDGRLMCINQSVALLRPTDGELGGRFLAAALRAPIYQERMVFDAGGTTIKHIYITRLAKMRIGLPPPAERVRIVEYVCSIETSFNTAISSCEKQIGLMQEFRCRLVADVVTGKLDIRSAAVRFPDDLDEAGAYAEELLEEDESISEAELDAEPEEIEA